MLVVVPPMQRDQLFPNLNPCNLSTIEHKHLLSYWLSWAKNGQHKLVDRDDWSIPNIDSKNRATTQFVSKKVQLPQSDLIFSKILNFLTLKHSRLQYILEGSKNSFYWYYSTSPTVYSFCCLASNLCHKRNAILCPSPLLSLWIISKKG